MAIENEIYFVGDCQMKIKSPPPMPESVLVNTQQFAELLGVSKRHLITIDGRGEIGPEPIKLGQRTLYAVSEIREWAAQGCPERAVWQART